ncbi:MAG: hypothetical protein WCB75_21015 [Pseudolabrys sp.]
MFYASSFSPCVIAFFRAALRRDERRRRDDRHRRFCGIACEPELPAAKDVSGVNERPCSSRDVSHMDGADIKVDGGDVKMVLVVDAL